MGTNATVLIVDDEPDVLLMVRINLEAEGFTTFQAANGAEALEIIDRIHPDVVLLDVMMPVVDGWGVLAALASERDAAPKVVMCSAKTMPHDIQRALALGAVAYVTKPFKFDILVETVRCAAATTASA